MTDIKLKEIVSWSKGHSVPRDDTSVSKNIPYLHYGDLYKKYNFRLDLNKEYKSIIKIDPDSKIKPEQYLHDGDIVFTLTSETVDDLGCCTLISNPEDLPFVTGMETTVVHILDKNVVYPPYLNYLFQTNRFQKELRQYVTGMKVYRVHPKDLMNITVNVPSHDIQKKIASFLDTISDKIVINHDINANLLELLKIQFTRVLKLSNDSIRLGDIADIQTGPFGSQLHQEDYVKDGTPLVSVENLGEFHLNRKHLPGITPEDCIRLSRYLMKEGDIIFSRVGYVDRSSYVSKMEDGWMFSGSCLRIRNNDPDYSLYTYLFLNTNLSKETFKSIAVGATRPSINSSILSEFEIIVPPKSYVKQFNDYALKLESMMTVNMIEIEKLTILRDYLLPKLMSGEINISTLEIHN